MAIAIIIILIIICVYKKTSNLNKGKIKREKPNIFKMNILSWRKIISGQEKSNQRRSANKESLL